MRIKRVFDFLVSLVGLIAISPLLVLIAVVVKSDSPGPALFRQIRVGKNGVPFRIRKFRTMYIDNRGLELTSGDDPRITRAGKFLRRYKLDELPQLIDVLQGTMSLVGPRPEVPKYIAAYPESSRVKVLSVPPGITDLASITFRNESEILSASDSPERTYLEQILPVKVQLYEKYADERSFLLDCSILLRTLLVVFSNRANSTAPPRKGVSIG